MSTTSQKTRPRWKWIILAGTVSLLTLYGVMGWLAIYDGSRSRALRLFESLKPGMREDQVLRLLQSHHNVRMTKIDGAISPKLGGWRCNIDERFLLGFCFHPDKTLWTKYVTELDPGPSSIPDWLAVHLDKIGIDTPPLHRHWP